MNRLMSVFVLLIDSYGRNLFQTKCCSNIRKRKANIRPGMTKFYLYRRQKRTYIL